MQAGELFNPVGGFGDRANGRFIQSGLDRIDVVGQFADGPDDRPTP